MVYNFRQTFDAFAQGKECSCAPVLKFSAVPLAVAWQSDQLESVNFLIIFSHIFCVFGIPCRNKAGYLCKVMQYYANLLQSSLFCHLHYFRSAMHFILVDILCVLGLPTMFHIFAHTVPVEERSRAFGYLVALGSVGQTVAAVVCLSCQSYLDCVFVNFKYYFI